MASKFPGGFGPGYMPLPFRGFEMPIPHQRQLSIPQALALSETEWNEVKRRINEMNTALSKLLANSTEKPTLRKVLTTLDEKKSVLSQSENEIIDIFFNILARLEQVKNALPIIPLLKSKSELNTILSDTTVHSTIHEDIAELVKKGATVSPRFRATVSVIPRLIDCLYSTVGLRPEKPKARSESSRVPTPSTTSSKPTPPHERSRRGSGEKQEHTAEREDDEELLLNSPDVEFQMLQHFEDNWNMQRKVAYQSVYERKCIETDRLKKENTVLLRSLQEKDKEIANLKKEVKTGTSETLGPSTSSEIKEQSQPIRDATLELQLKNILQRLDHLEADREKNPSTIHDKGKDQVDQLSEHLKYFRRRLAEYHDEEQLNFTYRTSNFAAGYFDHRGGFLEIEALNVSLFVPPGAIQSEEKTEVYIYVDTERQPLPCPESSQTVVAPIVQCGPPGLQFRESVVLTFPHCAEEETNWQFSALTSQSDEKQQANAQWSDLTKDDAICLVDNGRTVLLVNHFTLYTLAGEQKAEGSTVKKKMRVGAFGPSYSRGQDSYQLRVRAWDDTEASLDQVLKKEKRLRGQQLDDDRPICVESTGQPVDVNMSNLKAGWTNRYDEPEGQHIPFDHLWKPDVLPSCTIDLEVDDSRTTHNSNPRVKSGVHCKFDIQQRKSTKDAVTLKIDVCGQSEVKESGATPHTFSGAVQEKIFGPFDPKSGLSPKAYYELCEELNIDRGIPKDWRLLAEKLGCNFMTIENIKGNKTEEPTKLVLKVFFSLWTVSVKRPASALEFLMKTLKELGLTAAARIIEDDIATNQG